EDAIIGLESELRNGAGLDSLPHGAGGLGAMRAIGKTAMTEVRLKVAPVRVDFGLRDVPESELTQTGRVDDPDSVARGVQVARRGRMPSLAVAFTDFPDPGVGVRHEGGDE